MNIKISSEIQNEQNHGRRKYGGSELNFELDDRHSDLDWHHFIAVHNARALSSTPQERRQYLIKVAGLAVSAIEAYDRKCAKAAADCRGAA